MYRFTLLAFATFAAAFGCSDRSKQPAFPDLHPVQGVVQRDGKAVSSGVIQFAPIPDQPEFLVNSEIGSDGRFTLTTVRTTDSKGERKTGAAEGQYKVTYHPPLADQTAGGQLVPIVLSQLVEVNAGPNDLTIVLPRTKK